MPREQKDIDRARRWREANPDKVRAQQQRRYDRHRERLLGQQKEYYATHAEERREYARRYRDENRERIRQAQAAYYEANKERYFEGARMRRALVAGAPVVERVDRDCVIARDGRRCHICGKVVRGMIHLDHLVPLSKGGDHTHANLAVAHAHCNQSRHDGRLPAQLRLVG